MEHLYKIQDDFSPKLYIAILAEVAHSDGLAPEEKAMLEDYAVQLGIEPNSSMPEIPENLSDIPWSTRVLVYRDAYMMALADGTVSSEEDAYLIKLADRMNISSDKAHDIRLWTHDYENLFQRLGDIMNAEAVQEAAILPDGI